MTGEGVGMGIVGLDLSLTGTGMVRLANDDHEHWWFGTSPGCGNITERSFQIADEIRKNSAKGDIFFIEDYAYGISPKKSSLATLAELGGIVKLVLWRWTGKHPTVVGSGVIKKWISGRGDLKKDMIPVAVYKKFKVEFKKHDEFVAYALADFGFHFHNPKARLRPLLKYEEQVLKKFRKDLQAIAK